MKAIVLREYGPPEALRYEDVPDPEPRAGQVRIAVGAATVNRVLDVALRRGGERDRGQVLPLIPGVDCAGTIDRVGPGVTRWRVGDRVAAAGTMPLEPCAEDGSGYQGPMAMMGMGMPGGFAELVVVPACALFALPAELGFAEAAVAMRHAPTAWNLLCNVAQLQPDDWVLIMGAAGNLGSIGIQIAKNVVGAHVIAAAGSSERAAIGSALGADFTIDYSARDVLDEVLRITAGHGVDVLYDNIANSHVLPRAFLALRDDGRLVTAGAHGGPLVTLDFGHLYSKRITIRGTTGRRASDVPAAFAAVAQGKIKVQIGRILPLANAAEAHRIMEADPDAGKIVLAPRLAAEG